MNRNETKSLIVLPGGERIDTRYCCAYSYKNGRLTLVMCSGNAFECPMDAKRGLYWLTRMDAERGGTSPAIAPAEPKPQPEAELAEVIP